jgi:hypothetical protein
LKHEQCRLISGTRRRSELDVLASTLKLINGIKRHYFALCTNNPREAQKIVTFFKFCHSSAQNIVTFIQIRHEHKLKKFISHITQQIKIVIFMNGEN